MSCVPKSVLIHTRQNFRMLVSLLDSDPFLGRILTGRVISGQVRANDTVQALVYRSPEQLEQDSLSGAEPVKPEQARVGSERMY